jgi:S1-C subfamily serine protease
MSIDAVKVEQPSTGRGRLWLGCGLVVLAFVCLGVFAGFGGLYWFGTSDFANTISPTPVVSNTNATGPVPYLSVVQIRAKYFEDGRLVTGWTGSGSIISPEGYILTNAHVVLADKYFPVDALVIALTVGEDKLPVEAYYAEVVQADERLDLAVLRITEDLAGKLVNLGDLDLPYVNLGDADALRLGDSVTILGYPGIGGDTITLTAGEISGFTSQNPYGDRAFIKTSATIAGGNSGGLAADSDGNIVGVPTQLGYGGEDQFVDCRVLADTNRDGRVDDSDNCIPTGGFINALRPINLALPLISAAQRGEYNVVREQEPVQTVAGDIPEPGSVLLEDDFSNSNSGWDIGDSENGYADYVSGEFLISVNPDQFYIWSNANTDFANIIVSADVRISETTGEGDYGFMCRYQDSDNFYALEITEDGYYAIWMYEDGEYVALLDWAYSDLIPQHSGSRVLAAACVDHYLVLAVDGEIIAEVQDNTFSSGDLGLMAGTWDVGGLTIAFDNLLVTAPNE